MEVVKPYTKHEMTIFKATVSPPIFVSNYISWGRLAWRLARDNKHCSWNRLNVWTQGQFGSTDSQPSAFNSEIFKNPEHTWQKTLRLYYKYQSVDIVFGKCPLFIHTPCVYTAVSRSWSVWCWWKDIHFLRNTQRTAQCRTSLFPQQLFNFWHWSFTFNSNKSPTWCNHFSVYYPDVCLQLNMFRAFSRPLSGAQWLQWQPLVLPSYRGDSRAVFVVGPAAHAREHRLCLYLNARARDRNVPVQWFPVWTDRPSVGRNETVRPCSDIQEFCSLPTQRIMSSLSSPHLRVVTLYVRLPSLTPWFCLQYTAFASGSSNSISPTVHQTGIPTLQHSVLVRRLHRHTHRSVYCAVRTGS